MFVASTVYQQFVAKFKQHVEATLVVSIDTLPEWSKGVDSSSTSASCVGSKSHSCHFSLGAGQRQVSSSSAAVGKPPGCMRQGLNCDARLIVLIFELVIIGCLV